MTTIERKTIRLRWVGWYYKRCIGGWYYLSPLDAEVVVGLEGWMLRLKLGEIQPCRWLFACSAKFIRV